MKSYTDSLLMDEEFFGVMDHVMQTIALFSSSEMLKSSHGELEQQAAVKGREFCRTMIQANLDLRAKRERTVPNGTKLTEVPCTGCDGGFP